MLYTVKIFGMAFGLPVSRNLGQVYFCVQYCETSKENMIYIFLLMVAYYAWMRWQHRYRPQFDEVVFVRTSDGWEVPLHIYKPRKSNGEVLFMQHGLGANAQSFDYGDGVGMAPWFRARGYTVYVANGRGKGEARRTSDAVPPYRETRFQNYLSDLEVCLKWVSKRHRKNVHFIGHSLGGILGYCLVADSVHGKDVHLKSMMSIGSALDYSRDSQFRDVAKLLPLANWLPLVPLHWANRLMLPFRGIVNPIVRFGTNIDNMDDRVLVRWMLDGVGWEPSGVLQELAEMVLGRGLRRTDGTFYADDLSKSKIPVAALAGTVDEQSSEDAVRETFEACKGNGKLFRSFGRRYGEICDYGHEDLVSGREVDAEVYPAIQEWIESNSQAD
jgi:alpha-beta hydrolase superfamily lysophospholipase